MLMLCGPWVSFRPEVLQLAKSETLFFWVLELILLSIRGPKFQPARLLVLFFPCTGTSYNNVVEWTNRSMLAAGPGARLRGMLFIEVRAPSSSAQASGFSRALQCQLSELACLGASFLRYMRGTFRLALC